MQVADILADTCNEAEDFNLGPSCLFFMLVSALWCFDGDSSHSKIVKTKDNTVENLQKKFLHEAQEWVLFGGDKVPFKSLAA